MLLQFEEDFDVRDDREEQGSYDNNKSYAHGKDPRKQGVYKSIYGWN